MPRKSHDSGNVGDDDNDGNDDNGNIMVIMTMEMVVMAILW